MLKRLGLSIILCFVIVGAAMAQSDAGKIKGVVTDETGAPVEFATVVIIESGVIKGGAHADENGAYSIAPVTPGQYDVKASFAGNTVVVNDVRVIANKTVKVDLAIETGVELKEVEIYETIQIDQTTQGGTISQDDIKQIGLRSVNTLAAIVPGVYQADDGGGLSVRGGRGNATTYFVDGVKVRGVTSLPQKSIGQLTVITGGTPAEYGDMIGGIISITTMGPSYNLSAGGEILSSQFLDPYGYNLLALNASGPIITKYIDSIDYRKPILGFFIAGEAVFQKDQDPAQGGVWKLKDDAYTDYRDNPLQLNETGNFFIQRANFASADQFEKQKWKLNNEDRRIRASARLDFQPTDNIVVKFGATWEDIHTTGWGITNSLFAYEGSQLFKGNLFRGWARFQQSFQGGDDSKVKNLFYMLQADYNRYERNFMNADHRDNIWDYGYIGNFNYDREEVYNYIQPGNDNHYQSISSAPYSLTSGFAETNLTMDESGGKNPYMANYTRYILDWADQTQPINPFTGRTGLNNDYLAFLGGLRNGDSPRSIYSLFSGPGSAAGGYTKFLYEQYRLTGQASGEIKGHNLKIGFEFEQRSERVWGVASRFMWNYARQLTNRHLQGINTDPATWELVEVNGEFQDTVHAPLLFSPQDQSDFDKALRTKLGLDVNGTDWIITDNLDPSTYSLDMFTADELLNDGSYLVTYYGFDYKGNRTKRVADNDFFTDTQNRPMNAFAPTYISGFIQDKFELEDIIFNVGVRVDRFDANQKVLKDPFSLFPTYSAQELHSVLGTEMPTSVDPQWVPYTDNAENPTTIIGYRDGFTWYDATGSPTNASTLRVSGGEVQPGIKDDEVSIESFEDYEPQTVVMPRLSFSFPISGEAVFFAHYDVLTQRPGQTGTAGGSLLAGQLADFFYLQNSGTVQVTNPNLKPEKTVDYEVGFKQKLNDFMALSISAFYREMRDMIQTVNFLDAYPISYSTYDNIDFGTVKGFTFSLNMIRMKNIRMQASYTMQFASGTGSSFGSSRAALNSIEGFTAIRALLPLDFDQRHRFSGNVDYRFYGRDNKGPGIKLGEKTIYPLANAGANLTFYMGSGTPYSVNILPDASRVQGGINAVTQLGGTPNGSRLPWQYRFDFKIDKDIMLGGKEKKDEDGNAIKDGNGNPTYSRAYSLNVYLLLLNALNSKNILGVYPTSGLPDDDGYLATDQGQQQVAAQIDADAFTYLYTLKMQNPNNFSLPRRIRLGVQFSF